MRGPPGGWGEGGRGHRVAQVRLSFIIAVVTLHGGRVGGSTMVVLVTHCPTTTASMHTIYMSMEMQMYLASPDK